MMSQIVTCLATISSLKYRLSIHLWHCDTFTMMTFSVMVYALAQQEI